MSKEKQIEEMAKELAKIQCNKKGCEDCEFYQHECDDLEHYKKIAELLHNAGYRKQSENVIELPCKIGDIVYVITERHPCYACMYVGDFCHKDCSIKDKSKLVVKKVKVFYFLFQEMNNKIQVEVENTKHLVMHFLHFDIKDFGKTVFLTKQEAEQALAKMKGGAE